jgi:hypothetical protein
MAFETMVALMLAALLAWGVWAVRSALERIAKHLESRDEKPSGIPSPQLDELIRATWALQSLSDRPIEPPKGYDVDLKRRLQKSRRELRVMIEDALTQMLWVQAVVGEEDLHAFMQLKAKVDGLFGPKVDEGLSDLVQGLVTMVRSGPPDAGRMRDFIWGSWQQTQQVMLREIDADNDAPE